MTISPMISLFSNNIEIAEDEILKLADFIYTHTNIKPMSKVIYLISRLLLINNDNAINISKAVFQYNKIAKELEIELHGADYSFTNILHSAQDDFHSIFSSISRIKELTEGRDSLGIVFDTLLRGKYESGEGLGTFLTPEEVVSPSIDLCLHFLRETDAIGNAGDLCGGTGRFIHELHKKSKGFVFNQYILADQSAFSIELARINFFIESVSNAVFYFVTDSITDEKLTQLNSSFSLIATNPPFGAGKYLWSFKLNQIFKSDFLTSLGFSSNSPRIDPAEIFVYRNLLFLMEGGILGIVLPDGVAKGERLPNGIKAFENTYKCKIAKLALISLPARTFSLGGTVAKTSFVIFKKVNTSFKSKGIYIGNVNHIGFLKKGNRRITDPNGNDYSAISQGIITGKIKPVNTSKLPKSFNNGVLLSDLTSLQREYPNNGYKADYHISILDVDETGYIEFKSVMSNSPTTKPALCQAGDILVSCINPKIWRVTIIPNLIGSWSCSSEFAVLRPKNPHDTISLFLSLISEDFVEQAILLANGTSSSRQRINKLSLLNLKIVKTEIPSEISDVLKKRKEIYESRLAEIRLFFGDSAVLHRPDCNISGL